MRSLAPAFSICLNADPDRLHLAAHSHHPWPDTAIEAHRRYAQDTALWLDGKWSPIFTETMPRVQAALARHLGLSDPATLAFASNTHEFVRRLLSCLPAHRPPRILTTDSEFYSFARQVARLEEEGLVAVERVAAEPLASFEDRFATAAARGGHDLVFFSHVFFNSAWAIDDLTALVRAVPDPETLIAIDGYHATFARPVDLSAIEGRAFYLSGSYKYLMAGEGACFMHCPPGYGARPRDTGWFAAFGALGEAPVETVAYARDGRRFAGATFDHTALYRLDAVLRWLDEQAISVTTIHDHVRTVQRAFMTALVERPIPALAADSLIVPADSPRLGHFLTFRHHRAGALQQALAAANIITDHRGDRLRLGFGLYHDPAAMAPAVARLAAALEGFPAP